MTVRGQIIKCILWTGLCLLFCPALFGQMQKLPEELLSDQTLFLTQTNNGEELVVNLKSNWYDLFYDRAIENGELKPLDLPLPSAVFKLANDPNAHWLVSALQSLNEKGDVAKSIQEFAGMLEDDPDGFRESDDELVAEIASLFPGQIFLALDRTKTGFAVVYGIDFDPERFDWFQEMIGCLKTNDGQETEEFTVGNIPVYFLPAENTYFFQHDNVLYGVVDTDDEYCRQFAGRLTSVNTDFKNLTTSRHFGRVSTRIGNDRRHSDLFVYARVQDWLDRWLDTLDPNQNMKYGFEQWSKSHLGWSTSMGVSVKFAENGNRVSYRVVYPLTLPNEKSLTCLFDELKTLDIETPRTLLANVSETSYQNHGLLEKFPSLFDFHVRSIGSRLDIGLWNERFSEDSSLRFIRMDEIENVLFRVFMETGSNWPGYSQFSIDLNDEEINRDLKPQIHGVAARKSMDIRTVDDVLNRLKPLTDTNKFKNSMAMHSRPSDRLSWTETMESEIELKSKVTRDNVTIFKYGSFVTAFYIIERPDDFLVISAMHKVYDLGNSIEKLEFSETGNLLDLQEWYPRSPAEFGEVKIIHARRSFTNGDCVVAPVLKCCEALNYAEESSYVNRWVLLERRSPDVTVASQDLSVIRQIWRAICSEINDDRGVWNRMGRETSQFGNKPWLQVTTMTVGPQLNVIEFHGLIRDVGE